MSILKNRKHERFAHELAKGVSATEAAKVAGYSEKRAPVTGSELLHNRKIIVRVTEIRQNIETTSAAKIGVDKAWVLAELVDNVKMAKAAVPVLDNEGNPTGEYRAEIPAANRALELIGKEFGMFVDRKEVRTGPLSTLTDQQLDQLIAAIAAGTPAEVFAVLGNAGEAAALQGEPAQVLPPLH